MKPIISKFKSDLPQEGETRDIFTQNLEELFYIRFPNKKGAPDAPIVLEEFKNQSVDSDAWIYFPSEKITIHTLNEELYFELRTARNKNVITADEQNKYRDFSIGIAGLSVGSSVAVTLTMSGGPKNIKLADFDDVEISNLNRIHANILDVGENKTSVCAKRIWKLDPYANLVLYDKGISNDNLSEFILKESRVDVVIDAMDNLNLKTKIRLLCREQKIPVLMATDNGDGVILDVERFDKEPTRKIFHGTVPELEENIESLANLTKTDWLRLATKIVDPKYLTQNMQKSLPEIGKTLGGVPQLGPAATIAGSAIAFAIRRIANKQEVNSGRYIISLEEKLIPDYMNPENQALRDLETQEFIKKFMNL
jgi:molybdopterin/thiamine biosynthesis adenylyltransferase